VSKAAPPLTALQVERLKVPGRHAVGGVAGLHLRIRPSPSSSRVWTLRVVVENHRRDFVLGSYPTVTLAEAIESARAKRRELLGDEGRQLDVPKALDEASAAPPKQLTFAEAAEAYIQSHASAWKHARHVSHWRRSLAVHALPKIGSHEVTAIGIREVLGVLEPIWRTKTETASKVRGRIELILAWADKRLGVERPNPARWTGNLDTQLAARSKIAVPRHHPALPLPQIPAFMKALATAEGSAARALHFAILTAARPGEVCAATWKEVDFPSKTWVVPEERMKSGREHRVPLSAAAIALLESIPLTDDSDVIFQSPRGGELSNMALVAVCRRLGVECVPHGFRSSFRDWCAENSEAAPELAEMALAHAIGSEVEAAYRRGDLLVKRRKLMEDWSSFLQGGSTPGALASVVQLAKRRS
jgi:integrase